MRSAPNPALQAVRDSAMFGGLDGSRCEALLARGRVVHLDADESVVVAGQRADRLFVVVEGDVKVYHLSPRGDEQTLHRIGPGESFGEAAMFAGRDYPANAAAVTDSTLWVLPREALLEAIADEPDLAMGLLAGLSAKLREFAGLIEQLSLRQAPARLAAELLARADRAGGDSFVLSLTKRDLAARLGTTPETLSRALAKLKSAGLIDVAGSRIALLDRAGLNRLVQDG